MHTVTLIPGDGIGPSIMDAAVRVIEASGAQIQWDRRIAGMTAMESLGTPLPEKTLASIRQNRVAFKGPLTTPVAGGYRSVNVQLRQMFKLYANVRPAITFEGTRTPFKNVDMVIIRENTEGLYSGIEHEIRADDEILAAETIALITRAGSERIIRFAFEYARKHDRKRVTVVHKANILKSTTGMFLEIARKVAENYPDIEFNDRIIDACAMRMVMSPEEFDVIVTTNLFGDILSDLAAGLVGGLGLIAGANIGHEYAIFEAVHGSAPDIAGKNIANPTAVILAAVMMLDHLREHEAARRIEQAVREVIRECRCVTPDLKPDSGFGTQDMADEIIRKMQAQ